MYVKEMNKEERNEEKLVAIEMVHLNCVVIANI